MSQSIPLTKSAGLMSGSRLIRNACFGSHGLLGELTPSADGWVRSWQQLDAPWAFRV